MFVYIVFYVEESDLIKYTDVGALRLNMYAYFNNNL